ncbi:MAG: hypothetical protein LBQ81_09515 [Zoogloeaceae bacterium]|jgi:hypothetical protein|nr:hypothetical protein [Zoogloeaceae bacterium]
MKHTNTAVAKLAQANEEVLAQLRALYLEAFAHDGFAEIRVEIRILRRGQKEIILHCGKQYRFVVDFVSSEERKPKIGNATTNATTDGRKEA